MGIEQVCNAIENAISAARAPLATIPAILLICSAISRPGMSAMLIASRIIQRFGEKGIPTGNAADGSANLAMLAEAIRAEEYVKAIKLESRVQATTPIGGIQILATGSNSGGPVVSTGFNINFPHLDGVVG